MTLARYSIGFVLSLILTIVAYAYATSGHDGVWLYSILALLAIVQLVVQLVFFLHIADEKGVRYRLYTFLFMSGTLLIIVVGSLWIMHNLDQNMMNMSASEKDNYMMTQHDRGF